MFTVPNDTKFTDEHGNGFRLAREGAGKLPDGLVVNDRLDLRPTAVTCLPEGMVVTGGLDLDGTGISVLPEDGAVPMGYAPDRS